MYRKSLLFLCVFGMFFLVSDSVSAVGCSCMANNRRVSVEGVENEVECQQKYNVEFENITTACSCMVGERRVERTVPSTRCNDGYMRTNYFLTEPAGTTIAGCYPTHVYTSCTWEAPASDSENSSSTPPDETGRNETPNVGGVVSELQDLNQFGVSTPQDIIGKAIKAVMGIVGSIALAMFLYAGVLWMTSRGDSAKVATAAKIFLWSSLGLMALFASYAAVGFVLGSF